MGLAPEWRILALRAAGNQSSLLDYCDCCVTLGRWCSFFILESVKGSGGRCG